jgi:hypothetical protein
VRPLAAEKSTKNRHFSTFYVLLFLKIWKIAVESCDFLCRNFTDYLSHVSVVHERPLEKGCGRSDSWGTEQKWGFCSTVFWKYNGIYSITVLFNLFTLLHNGTWLTPLTT